MTHAARLLLLLTVLACAGPAHAAARGAAPGAASMPAPHDVVRSSDGRWVAYDHQMRQPGWGLMLLAEHGQFVRALPGWRAIEFERNGSRLLAMQVRPADDDGEDGWYALLDLAAAEDPEMGEVPVRRVHRADGRRFLGWISPTLLVFEHAPGSAARDTVDLATLR